MPGPGGSGCWPCRNATANSSGPSNARGYRSTVASTGRPGHGPGLEGDAVLGRAEPESLLGVLDRFLVERFSGPTGRLDCGVQGRIRLDCEGVTMSSVMSGLLRTSLMMSDGPREAEGGVQALLTKPRK